MTDLPIRVTPKSSRNEIKLEGDVIRVYVAAPPADNQANKAVVELLAKKLSLPKSRLQITRGHSSRDKVVAIPDLDQNEIFARLASP